MKKTHHFFLWPAFAAVLMNTSEAQFALQQLDSLQANIGDATVTGAGEITSYDPATNRLFVTRNQADVASGVNYFDLTDPSNPQPLGFIDFSGAFGGGANEIYSLTSVAADPLGRGFGVAAIVPKVNIPANGDYRTGLIGFFDTTTGAVLKTLDVGYHPDSVVISPDGSRVLVANEGEYTVLAGANQRPGSVSVLDVSSVTAGNRAAAIGALTSGQVATVDFTGVDLSGLRMPAVSLPGLGGNETPVQAMEPEYIAVVGNRAFVALQDNNALAELDLGTLQWTSVRSLGTINQSIDAISSSPAQRVQTHVVAGQPMPDNIAAFEQAGKTYIVTANEGDARVDNTGATNTTRDDIRVSNLGQTNYPGYDGDTPLDPALNNLRIDRLAGDTDNDGSINVITTFGTRSFSIYDADTGDLVWDSGSFFETWIAANDPDNYPESRSVQKGPEPEAIAVGMVDGQRLAAIGLERSNHVFLFNITDPTAPVFQDFKLATDEFGNEHLRPESINFISAADSPTGQPLLVVGFEGDESRDSERLAIFAITQVPEPGSATLCGLVLTLGALRRRRTSAPRSGGCRGGRYAGEQ